MVSLVPRDQTGARADADSYTRTQTEHLESCTVYANEPEYMQLSDI